jgi:hypothetical protein
LPEKTSSRRAGQGARPGEVKETPSGKTRHDRLPIIESTRLPLYTNSVHFGYETPELIEIESVYFLAIMAAKRFFISSGRTSSTWVAIPQ